jgi:hypothetical protein
MLFVEDSWTNFSRNQQISPISHMKTVALNIMQFKVGEKVEGMEVGTTKW